MWVEHHYEGYTEQLGEHLRDMSFDGSRFLQMSGTDDVELHGRGIGFGVRTMLRVVGARAERLLLPDRSTFQATRNQDVHHPNERLGGPDVFDVSVGYANCQRRELLRRIQELQESSDQPLRILDVGGSYNSWTMNITTAFVDMVPPFEEKDHSFKPMDSNATRMYIGNINYPMVWEQVLADVKRDGKYDVAICSHTLEDVALPGLAALYLPQAAHSHTVHTSCH
mmetsp:Transcript_47481/g.111739  ORF Transcript_47481/g.111739 Transcript_47481/m.111739 type:complete len:225 (-) Transcript_47481:573-1247(-)